MPKQLLIGTITNINKNTVTIKDVKFRQEYRTCKARNPERFKHAKVNDLIQFKAYVYAEWHNTVQLGSVRDVKIINS